MLFEILLKLNTGYLEKGIVIRDRVGVIKNYLFTIAFYIDLQFNDKKFFNG